MNKNIFSTSDNESDVKIKVDTGSHPFTPENNTGSGSYQSDWVSDAEYKIKDDNEHPMNKEVESLLLESANEDCPSLSTPSKASTFSNKSRKERKKNEITFTIGTSYIDKKRYESAQNQQPNYHGGYNDSRTTAFTKIENKEDVFKSLSCTRACKNVLKRQESGEYGVCYRNVCTFAHSLDELKDPMCGFDASCRFRYGRTQRDRTVDSKGTCMFRHRDETREDWLKRTNRNLPDLPATSEKTRNPNLRKDDRAHSDKVKALGSGYAVKNNLATPAAKITLNTPSAPRKMPWGEKVPAVISTPVSSLTPKKLELMESDLSSSDYDSHYRKRSYHRRHRKISLSPRRRRLSPSSKTRVIRVPTEELAKIAIHAAFERGVYNIQVLVE